MADRVITLKLTIDPSGAITAVNDLVTQTGKKVGNALETPLANIAARGFGIKTVIDGMTASFGEWIRASNDGEIAVAKLTQAMQQQGNFSEAALQSILDYASARQNATGIDDDATVAIAAQLTAMKLSGDQLENAIALTQDLSTLMDGDMQGAVRLIADAFNGNVGMLKKYVKGLDETDIKQRGTISIIEQLTKAVGGQAIAVGNTGAGGLKKMDAAADDLKQTFGDLLKTALAPAVGVITEILRVIVAAPPAIQIMALGVTVLAGAFVLLGTSMFGLPLIIGGIVTAAAGLATFLKGVKDSNKGVVDSSDAATESLDKLALSIARLRAEAGKSDELDALQAKLDKLRNPDTESSLEAAFEKASARSAEYRKDLEDSESVLQQVFALERQGIDIRTKNPELAERYFKIFADGTKSSEQNIAELAKKVTKSTEEAKAAEISLEDFRQKKRTDQVKSSNDIENQKLQAVLDRSKITIGVEKLVAITAIDNDEKTLLARATSESEKLSITRNAALLRIEAEEAASLKILDNEKLLLIARRESASIDERMKINRRIETIGVERSAVLTTTTENIKTVEVDFTIGTGALALPGTLRAIEDQITLDRQAMQDARSDSERKAIRERIHANQAAVDAMQKSDEELLADQKLKNEERKRLWIEQHQVAMVAINAIGAGVGEFWNQYLIDHRQAKDQGDAIWLTIKNTAFSAIGAIVRAEVEAAFIGLAAHETAETGKNVATSEGVLFRLGKIVLEGAVAVGTYIAEGIAFALKETVKTAVFLAQSAIRAAAWLAEMAAAIAVAVANAIAAAGPFAIFAAAGFIAAGIALVATMKKAFGFREGGELLPGQFGGNETNEAELIAPKRNFRQVIMQDIMPQLNAMNRAADAKMQQAAVGTDTRMLRRLESIENILRKKNFSPRLVGALDGQTFLDENLKTAVARDNSFKR